MSYQDKLDRNASIKIAKKELEDFSDLLKIMQPTIYPNITSSANYKDALVTISYLNHDSKLLKDIQKNDERILEINKIFNAMQKLDEEEIQIIFMKYVLMYDDQKLQNYLLYVDSTIRKKINIIYFKISIILDIAVKKRIDKTV